MNDIPLKNRNKLHLFWVLFSLSPLPPNFPLYSSTLLQSYLHKTSSRKSWSRLLRQAFWEHQKVRSWTVSINQSLSHCQPQASAVVYICSEEAVFCERSQPKYRTFLWDQFAYTRWYFHHTRLHICTWSGESVTFLHIWAPSSVLQLNRREVAGSVHKVQPTLCTHFAFYDRKVNNSWSPSTYTETVPLASPRTCKCGIGKYPLREWV